MASRFCLGLLLLLSLLYGAYLPSTGFGLSFDDTWNLNGLSSVKDIQTGLEFVLGGASGPLGRPVALATFLPNLHSWPSAPQDLILQNILLHLLNTALVVWLGFRVAPHLPWPVPNRAGFALVMGAWWGSSPLLHSTSAMIIQRMTSLSATFCLVALVAYVVGREACTANRWRGLITMTLAVGFGTAFAALSKENGALLPGYLLVLERLLLSRSPTLQPAGPLKHDWLARWQLVFLILPALALTAYLIINITTFWADGSGRTFTLAQRLMSEPRVLFTYLRLFLFPVRGDLGPYHDDFPPSTGLLEPLTTLPAIAGLLLAVGSAWLLRKTRWWLFSFAVAWFLWGHVLESTVLPLELYFEHRNYLPVLGVALFLSALAFHPALADRLRWVVLGAVLGLNCFVLRECSLLWSEPKVAAALWYERRPESLRALQFHLIQLSQRGSVEEYIGAVDAVRPPLSERAESAVMRVAAYCGLRDGADMARVAEAAVAPLGDKMLGGFVPTILDRITDAVVDDQCPGLDVVQLKKLLAAAVANPNPLSADARAQLHEIRARLSIHLRDRAMAIEDLDRALALRPTLSDAIALCGIFLSEGRYQEASHRLDLIEQSMPRRPFVAQRWRETIAEMRGIIAKARSTASGEP